MNIRWIFATALAVSTSITVQLSQAGQAGTIEGLHHWTSGGEVKALNVIQQGLKERGYTWQDTAVGGQSGANAKQVLQTRIAARNPPGTVQLLGYEGLNLAAEGLLRDLSSLPGASTWESVLAPALLPLVRSDKAGLFSVPINMHRTNWVWANKKVLDEAGLEIPTSWQQLVDMGPVFKAKGIIPLATGDENWQIGTIFDAILLDINGAAYFKKAVLDLDAQALSQPEMVATFDMLRKVRGLVDDNFTGRDWSVATGMVINQQAAMQIMGDWAKGEFLAKGLKPGVDFLCFPTPTNTANYTFNVDTFGMFKTSTKDMELAQNALAETIMNPKIQHDFNVIKGSIPSRIDVSVDDMDQCAQRSAQDRADAIKAGTMFGSITQGLAVQPEFAIIFNDVAAQFFVSNMTSEDAVKRLVTEIDNAR